MFEQDDSPQRTDEVADADQRLARPFPPLKAIFFQ
jgi:hypothetical protein